MRTDKIGIACDHAGYERKLEVISFLKNKGFEVIDYGCNSTESCDYADFAHPLGVAIDNGDVLEGIAICGSGNGIAMTMNKHQKVRAALCWEPEIAQLARQHNNCNVLVIPARFTSESVSDEMLEIFLTEPFEGGRHQNRINKIPLS